jgi:hypothetical protein
MIKGEIWPKEKGALLYVLDRPNLDKTFLRYLGRNPQTVF